MRARSFFFLLCCAMAAAFARAEVEFGFAVPDEGRITLGVFDTSGRMVRILHNLSAQEEFRTGLNGLITSWDGKNDAGDPLPSGRYHIRGYLIGDRVSVAGEEFLFNDFAGDPGFPGLTRIHGIALLENADALLLGETAGKNLVLARFSDASGFVWAQSQGLDPRQIRDLRQFVPSPKFNRPPPPLGSSIVVPASSPQPQVFPPILASNAAAALVIAPSLCGTFSLKSGEPISVAKQFGGATPLAAAGDPSSWFVSSSGGLTATPIGGSGSAGAAEEVVSTPPAAFTALDADTKTLIGATSDAVWLRRETWEKWSGPSGARSLSLGTPGTFWFVGANEESPFVAQATFEGEILRLMKPDPGDPAPEQIRSSRTGDAFLVLEASPGLQRLRAMTRSAAGKWEIDWERTIRESTRFGFADGQPAPDVGDAEPLHELRIHMEENPLNGRKDFLLVHADSDKSGSGLFSPDGLPLVRVSDRPGIQRVDIHRGSTPDSILFLQGNGAFVERFSIQGLSDILPIDAGDIDLP